MRVIVLPKYDFTECVYETIRKKGKIVLIITPEIPGMPMDFRDLGIPAMPRPNYSAGQSTQEENNNCFDEEIRSLTLVISDGDFDRRGKYCLHFDILT